MELNHETLSAMRTSFNLKFKQAVEGAETIYRDLADIEGDPKLRRSCMIGNTARRSKAIAHFLLQTGVWQST